MEMTDIQTLIAGLTFLGLLGGGFIAYGVLKGRVNSLSRENETQSSDLKQIQRDFAQFREHSAQNYVSHMHISQLEERMARTEERVVGELRHMRETLVNALQDLAHKPKE